MSLIALKTLKDLSHELLQNIYDKNDRIVDITKEFLLSMWPIMSDKNHDNKYLTESVSELLYTLLDV